MEKPPASEWRREGAKVPPRGFRRAPRSHTACQRPRRV